MFDCGERHAREDHVEVIDMCPCTIDRQRTRTEGVSKGEREIESGESVVQSDVDQPMCGSIEKDVGEVSTGCVSFEVDQSPE